MFLVKIFRSKKRDQRDSMIPNCWPKNVTYLTNTVVTKSSEDCLRKEDIPLRRDCIELRKVPKNHSAYDSDPNKGFGVFCTKFIPCGTIIGEYTGETGVYFPKSNYRLEIDHGLTVDAYRAGNEVYSCILSFI